MGLFDLLPHKRPRLGDEAPRYLPFLACTYEDFYILYLPSRTQVNFTVA